MKLATLPAETASGRTAPDGRLVVVSRDLTRCTAVPHIAPTLQAALDDWDRLAPRLERAAEMLEHDAEPSMRFREHEALAPLPRAFAFLDGSAYLHHVRLARRSRGAEMPRSFETDPLMYQGASDAFLAPRAPVRADPAHGPDFEGEIAVITGAVARGGGGRDAVRLVMLMNDVSLRALVAPELAKGFGFVHSKPPSALSPVAVTPDELGATWDGARLHATLRVDVDGAPFGRLDAGTGMQFGFPELVAHAARTRPLGAGTVIGSGTVSNEDGQGSACLVERRMIELLEDGEAHTPWWAPGQSVRMEVLHPDGGSVFGAIEQTLEPV